MYSHLFRTACSLLAVVAASGASADTNSLEAAQKSPFVMDITENTRLTFYGYVKGTFISDSDYDLGDTTLGLKNIGTIGGPAAGSSKRAHLRESRLGFFLQSGDVRARIEGDFFGADGLRTRHAYVAWKGVMVGQNWTNFMSVETLGNTIDFQGPAGLPFARLPQLRYTFKPNENWRVSASIEEDVGNADDQHYTFAARYGFDKGMMRVAGLYRDTTLAGTAVKGWGLSLSGTYDAWDGGKLSGIYTTGEGISDILVFGLSGAAVTTGGNEVGVNGLSLGISQQIGDKTTLVATTGYTDLETAAATDTKSLTTLHLSAFHQVASNVQLGVEYYTGTRKQGNGVKFDADRILFSAKFTF